jgi:Transmembrane exosortase (Exosortase_EpsH)
MHKLSETFTRLPWQVRLAIAALAGLLWVYWPTLMELAGRWGSESQYSHGYLVPAFAVYLLWARRQWLPTEFQPNAWGLPVLAGGVPFSAPDRLTLFAFRRY